MNILYVLFSLIVIGSILWYGYTIAEPEPIFTRYIYKCETLKLPNTELEESNREQFELMCAIYNKTVDKFEDVYQGLIRKLGY